MIKTSPIQRGLEDADLAVTIETFQAVGTATPDPLADVPEPACLPVVSFHKEVVLASPAEMLFEAVRRSISQALETPKKETEIADALKVTKAQVKDWLLRLIEEGHIEKVKGSVYQLRRADLIDLCSSNDILNASDKK